MLYEITVQGLNTWSFGGKIYRSRDAQGRELSYVVTEDVAEAAARVEPGTVHGPHGIDIIPRPDATEKDIGSATHEHHDAPKLAGNQMQDALSHRLGRSTGRKKEAVNV